MRFPLANLGACEDTTRVVNKTPKYMALALCWMSSETAGKLNFCVRPSSPLSMNNTCPHCGCTLPIVVDAFCPECGEDLDEVPRQPRRTSEAAAPRLPSIEDGEIGSSIELVGEASKERFFAGVLDNVLAIGASLATAMALAPASGPVIGAALVGVYLAYYLVTEMAVCATPGKLLLGLRVVSLSGEKCSFHQVAIRTLARVLEVNPILLGGLPAAVAVLVTERKQRLGDLIAGTVVVSNRNRVRA